MIALVCTSFQLRKIPGIIVAKRFRNYHWASITRSMQTDWKQDKEGRKKSNDSYPVTESGYLWS
jgi:hypothetical protein